MSQTAEHKRYLRVGVLLVLVGAVTALIGSLAVHMTGLPKLNAYGVEIYSFAPRGWVPVLISQIVGVSGFLIIIAGMALALLYKREITWARATMGAFLFTSLMIILFGVIPNQFLTLTQSTLDWSGLKKWITIPKPLVFGNDVSISAKAIKDMIGQGYIITVTVLVAGTMWKWQERAKKLADEGPPPEVSNYGRPLTRVER